MLYVNKKGLRNDSFCNEDGNLNWQIYRTEEAQGVIEIFQQEQNHPRFRIIEELLLKIQLFERLAQEVEYDPEALERLRPLKRRQQALALEKEIHAFFLRIKIIATPSFPGPGGWTHAHAFVSGRPGSRDFDICLWGELLYRAMMDGYTQALRRCEKCRTWYAARRRDQKFCSDICRERQLRGTDEGKAKRAAYMKKYRAGLKRMSEENLRAAKRRK
jgi:hypothetical protein